MKIAIQVDEEVVYRLVDLHEQIAPRSTFEAFSNSYLRSVLCVPEPLVEIDEDEDLEELDEEDTLEEDTTTDLDETGT